MKTYHQEWKMKHPTDLDFLQVMEKESGMILDWYYEYFVQTTKTIDYGINSVIGTPEETKVMLERVDLMPMPLEIVVEYKDGSKELYYIPLRMMRNEKPAENEMERTVLEDWPWVEPDYHFTIDAPASDIKTISIDPTDRLADINEKNDVFDVEALLED
jgi:hypothetical protein